ncbi:GMC family oxidoreductase N-terminal domain-containing protein [Streptomyces sp. M19]
MLLRSSDHEFKAASRDGHGEDWPLSYADLAPYYDRVEEFLGLYGTAEGLPNLPDGRYRGPSLLTEAEKEFKATVEGRWPDRHVAPGATPPQPAPCALGIVAARETGRLTTRTDAIVRKITVNPRTGLADGAIFIDRHTKKQTRVYADVVVSCASAIESVRLLLNSADGRHPDGLANSSGLLGHYFMDQTPACCSVTTRATPEPRRSTRRRPTRTTRPSGASTSRSSRTSTAPPRPGSPAAGRCREPSAGCPYPRAPAVSSA